MTKKDGTISFSVQEDHFLLQAEAHGQSMSMEVTLEMMQALSLGLSQLLSDHQKKLTDGSDRPPILDIVAPQLSFSTGKMGVEMTVSAHGLAPIKLTFPITQALNVVKDIMEQMQIVASNMGLDLTRDP